MTYIQILFFKQAVNFNLTWIIISSLCGYFLWNPFFFSTVTSLTIQQYVKGLLVIKQTALVWI